jgi:hypothetical protein
MNAKEARANLNRKAPQISRVPQILEEIASCSRYTTETYVSSLTEEETKELEELGYIVSHGGGIYSYPYSIIKW